MYRAQHWLSQLEFITNYNYTSSSYRLKHYCENWWQQQQIDYYPNKQGGSGYVSNGSLIMAACALEMEFTDTNPDGYHSLNVFFKISKKSLKKIMKSVN